MKKLKKILFLYITFGSFVKTDFEILKKQFKLVEFQYKAKKNLFEHVFYLTKQFFWLVRNIIFTQIVYIWFADYHSFLPILFTKLFNKKSLLVLGGYDVTYVRHLNYGSFKNPLRAFCAKFSIKNASLNLAVSDNIAFEAQERVPNAKIQIVYTGYDENKYYPSSEKKENLILTVANADSHKRIEIKGIDLFIEVASLLSEYQFMIIGVNKNALDLFHPLPTNLVIKKRVSDADLLRYYQLAKVYAQFSIREGFPSAICEAMLCQCIPVGANRGGIPIAIGDSGFLFDKRDRNEAAQMIRIAMHSDETLGKKARERIIKNFSVKHRNVILSHLTRESAKLDISDKSYFVKKWSYLDNK